MLYFALRQGVVTAVIATALGWMTGNPHWWTLNPVVGFALGFLVGSLAYGLYRFLFHGWM